MASIFSKIIKKEIPAHIIEEDENHIAFLDINPLQKGHTLVVPKNEVDQIFDLSPNTLASLHIFAQRIAKAQKLSFPCNRIAVVVLGLEVPHAHIHLIPINSEKDANFSTANRPTFSTEEMVTIAQTIKNNL